jgi:hypothetical protein
MWLISAILREINHLDGSLSQRSGERRVPFD